LNQRKHLCLAFHCLKGSPEEAIEYNSELFVSLTDIKELILELKDRHYYFTLPHLIKNDDIKTCSITFDDGYFNNSLFLDLAQEYKIPFILFVTSFNIINKMPYLWDIKASYCDNDWHFIKSNYAELYGDVNKSELPLKLTSDQHRPFTIDELKSLSSNEFCYIANHTIWHQPLTHNVSLKNVDFFSQCNDFLNNFDGSLKKDIALPCGLLSRSNRKILLQHFDRIYTINGGYFSHYDRIINRISLVSPVDGSKLIDQVDKECRFGWRLKKKASFVKMSQGY
jgi:hypothetical protein